MHYYRISNRFTCNCYQFHSKSPSRWHHGASCSCSQATSTREKAAGRILKHPRRPVPRPLTPLHVPTRYSPTRPPLRIGIRQAPRGDRRAGRGAISHLSACSVTSRKWKRRDGNLSQRRPRFNHSTFSCPPQADPANCRLALRRQLRQAFCDDEGEKNLRPPLIASITWSCALVSYMPFKWSWFCPTSPP